MYDIKIVQRVMLKNNFGKKTGSFEGITRIKPTKRKKKKERNGR